MANTRLPPTLGGTPRTPYRRHLSPSCPLIRKGNGNGNCDWNRDWNRNHDHLRSFAYPNINEQRKQVNGSPDQPIALSDAEVVGKLKRKPSEGEQTIASLSEGAAKKRRKTVETVSVRCCDHVQSVLPTSAVRCPVSVSVTVSFPAVVLAAPTPTPTPTPHDPVDYAYTCFIVQILTELLFSYDESCKIAFLSFTPKKCNQTPATEGGAKHRTAAIQLLLSDLMTFGAFNPQPPSEAHKQIRLDNRATLVIVALCVDTATNHEIKGVPTALVSVRKFSRLSVAHSRTFHHPTAPRSAIAACLPCQICHRLLAVRFNVNGKKAGDEVLTHIAKVMLEKNFVAALTDVFSEVDLDYPNICTVVSSVWRPLEYLYGVFDMHASLHLLTAGFTARRSR